MTDYKADGTPTHTAEDGTLRKSRYGEGRQPWDDIKDLGWAPHFAAGNVLKYLRRGKDREHSIESARWYYARLSEMVGDVYLTMITHDHWALAHYALKTLDELLTEKERDLLRGETKNSVGSGVDQHLSRRETEDKTPPGSTPAENFSERTGAKSDR